MDNKKRPTVYDVKWTEIYREISSDSSPNSIGMGEINFRKNKKRSKMKILLKGVAFVLIASVSGAVSGAYIAEKNYSKQDPAPSFPIGVGGYGTEPYVTVSSKNNITRVAEDVSPAVVGISNSVEGFMGQVVNKFSGSGVIFKKDGYIVTNYHVIDGADKVLVKLSGGSPEPMPAKVVGVDKKSDLAVLKIEGDDYPVARFGDSAKVRAGDVAIAIGNPLGEEFAGSVTAGIISATNRRIEILDAVTREKTIYKVLQTDAAINPGNSGGPLCNELGEVVGINSLKAAYGQTTEGMGFAISVNEVMKVITSLMNEGKVRRPDLGIQGHDAVPDNNKVQGVYVIDVNENAAKAGLKRTDIIIAVDGVVVKNYNEFKDIIDKHKIGDTVTCKVSRSGKEIELKVVLGEQK